MNLEEIIKQKKALEMEMRNLINNFMSETGLVVADINIRLFETCGKPPFVVSDLRMEVVLP